MSKKDTTTHRCHARDARGQRCEDDDREHPMVIAADGVIRRSHHTKYSWWVEKPEGPTQEVIPPVDEPG